MKAGALQGCPGALCSAAACTATLTGNGILFLPHFLVGIAAVQFWCSSDKITNIREKRTHLQSDSTLLDKQSRIRSCTVICSFTHGQKCVCELGLCTQALPPPAHEYVMCVLNATLKLHGSWIINASMYQHDSNASLKPLSWPQSSYKQTQIVNLTYVQNWNIA